jgi:hypothetical protein
MGHLQQVSAHQHGRSTNFLPQLTARRACLVVADTRAQALDAKHGVESAEALSTAGSDASGLNAERYTAARPVIGLARSVMLLTAKPRRAATLG